MTPPLHAKPLSPKFAAESKERDWPQKFSKCSFLFANRDGAHRPSTLTRLIKQLRPLLVVAAVVVVVGLVGVDRTQEVAEHPLGDMPPLLPSPHVIKAEVDTLEDSHVYDITSDIRETIVVARLHPGRRRSWYAE